MKLLILLLFPFATTVPLLLALEDEYVKDNDGVSIYYADDYYVVPALFGLGGGGLILNRPWGLECPLGVFQSHSKFEMGLPVRLTINKNKTDEDYGGKIPSGTPLDIEFVGATLTAECNRHTKWVMAIDDHSFYSSYVGIGGAQDHPRKRIDDGTFSIHKSPSGYKFMYCPKIGAPPGKCFDVTRYGVNWYTDDSLGLTDPQKKVPCEVMFVKKEDSDANNGRSVA